MRDNLALESENEDDFDSYKDPESDEMDLSKFEEPWGYVVDYGEDSPSETGKIDNGDGSDLIEKMIDELQDSFPKALPKIRSDIAPAIAPLEDSLAEYYISKLKKKTQAPRKSIVDEIKVAKQNLLPKDTETAGVDEISNDPEIQQLADEIAQDPLLFKNKIDTVNSLGVINERKPIALYLVTIDSRVLQMGSTGSEALATKNSGPYGAGKSHPMFACLTLYPKTAYHLITSGSGKSLYNIDGGLKHKALILTEALQLQGDNGTDNELAYAIRSLVSEGRLTYQYTGYDAEGKKVTIIKKMEGPTSLLTTTVRGRLEAQLEDRLITVHPNISSKQTQDILFKTADMASGNSDQVDKKTISAWKLYHDTLEPVEVVIPYARKIADYVNAGGDLPISARRAFKRVLSVIKTMVTLYQKQRGKDDLGRVIADISDYAIAFQLIEASFRETLGESARYTDKRIKHLMKEGSVLPRVLADKFGVSGAAISQWSKPGIEKGVLSWCDENGSKFLDTESLEKAKRIGKAYIRVVRANSLPTPFQLTGDPRWDVDGELYQMYDLGFDSYDSGGLSLDNAGELTESINTTDGVEGDKIIKDSVGSKGSVKAFSGLSRKEFKNQLRKEREEHEKLYDPNNPRVKELIEEFGDFLKNDHYNPATEGILTI